MNKTERKQIHQALVNAIPYLALPTDRPYSANKYICVAICNSNSGDGPQGITQGANLAYDMIGDRLYPSISLYGWLSSNRKIKQKDLTWKNMQTHRHAWLKMLIEEFSK